MKEEGKKTENYVKKLSKTYNNKNITLIILN